MQSLTNYLNIVKDWLMANYLLLNETKTEAIAFSAHSSPTFSHLPFDLKTIACNLGVQMDSTLKMDAHFNNIVKFCFFHLQYLSKLKPLLKRNHIHTVFHPCIDPSNSCLYGTNLSILAQLQFIQNAAAHFFTNTRCRHLISSVLATLHRLPVHFRRKFMILIFVYKALHGLTPKYLTDLFSPYIPPRSLRSAEQYLLQVPKLKGRGSHTFSICRPSLQNNISLPITHANPCTLKVICYLLSFRTSTISLNSSCQCK